MIYINFRIHPIVYRRVIDLLRKSNYFEKFVTSVSAFDTAG